MKKRIKPFIPYIIVFGIIVSIFIADSILFKAKHAKMISRIAIYCFVLVFVIDILIELRYIVKAWLKRYTVLLFIILISIIIPFVVHFVFYRDNPIEESDLLNFYGSYLTFIGAFSLGYYLLKKDEKTQLSTLRKKADMLYHSMKSTMDHLSRTEAEAALGITIPFNAHWREDYYDIQNLVQYERFDLEAELNTFYTTVEKINQYIEQGEKDKAVQVYKSFIKVEQYHSSYDYIHAWTIIGLVSLGGKQIKSWKEEKKELMMKYADQFYGVVHLWIKNYMIRNNLTTCSLNSITYQLVDWLSLHPDLKELIQAPSDKGKINDIVFQIALKIRDSSKNMSFCWGEFTLLNKD